MADITIRHTHADGTLIQGSRKGDGVYEILKGLGGNWRWFPGIGRIGIGQSRDRAAHTYKIGRAAEALRAAGHTVTVEIDESERRTFAEAEAERNERAEERADRLSSAAASASARATALHAQARQMGEAIPFGQPMMPDHYSYRRDKRYRQRIGRTYERSFAESDKAEHYAHRAGNAETYQANREDVPRTRRRIAKLEADARRIQRAIDGRLDYVSDGNGGHKLELVKPGPAYLAKLETLAADIAEQLAYWRGIIEQAEADGVKVWSAADFTKGDFALSRWGWVEVLRVNPKSLTHPWGANAVHLDVVTKDNVRSATGSPGWTGTAPYDEVRGRKSAAEMAEMLAGQGVAP